MHPHVAGSLVVSETEFNGGGGLQTQIKNRVGLFLPALLNYGRPQLAQLGSFLLSVPDF
jgi:hypothetical protein